MRQGPEVKNGIVCTQRFSGRVPCHERESINWKVKERETTVSFQRWRKRQETKSGRRWKNVEEEGYNKKERKGKEEGVGGNGLGRFEYFGRRVEGFITQVSSLKATHTKRSYKLRAYENPHSRCQG
ncbi:hypothetical protein BPAE_0274g00010 [Botrytis paeoniae]|uniref:Uncharacterized protein n=1 Tax=Botrytis paeoniae TaxID=278948 RepID=A0A4Z1FGT8_9HELO|nr:hypothetical protein BPAE_0274g00010 [Botrytis paeoniae]